MAGEKKYFNDVDDDSVDIHGNIDVTTTPPILKDVLEWDGTNFVPKPKGDNTGAVIYSNPITPPSIVAQEDDYTPTGISDSNILRLSSTGNNTITGLAAPSPAKGQVILLVNIGSGNITLSNNDGDSLAVNRFLMSGNKNVQSEESVQLTYDVTSQRWRVISENL